MAQDLEGKTIAIVVTSGFEQVELTEPKRALEQAGARTHIVSAKKNRVKAWNRAEWGEEFDVDVPILEARPEDYDAVLLPGGVINADFLRLDEAAVRFVAAFFESGKPVASICHGPWVLIEAGVVKGRRMTSYPSLRTDLENAGADWVNQEVAVDGGLITSRNPHDLPAFNREMIKAFAEGRPAAKSAAA